MLFYLCQIIDQLRSFQMLSVILEDFNRDDMAFLGNKQFVTIVCLILSGL